eukprot:TRINITY_DN7719_c0_g1_i1.p1 TRINITY_DN7719_c0_g1~~TRINITY_DN7719_c0_g1_i1.p1  ORF type:complete len:456 (-),score=96.47 TRINITY_DN7719_c0_g1_i1:230-1399(-)
MATITARSQSLGKIKGCLMLLKNFKAEIDPLRRKCRLLVQDVNIIGSEGAFTFGAPIDVHDDPSVKTMFERRMTNGSNLNQSKPHLVASVPIKRESMSRMSMDQGYLPMEPISFDDCDIPATQNDALENLPGWAKPVSSIDASQPLILTPEKSRGSQTSPGSSQSQSQSPGGFYADQASIEALSLSSSISQGNSAHDRISESPPYPMSESSSSSLVIDDDTQPDDQPSIVNEDESRIYTQIPDDSTESGEERVHPPRSSGPDDDLTSDYDLGSPATFNENLHSHDPITQQLSNGNRNGHSVKASTPSNSSTRDGIDNVDESNSPEYPETSPIKPENGSNDMEMESQKDDDESWRNKGISDDEAMALAKSYWTARVDRHPIKEHWRHFLS